MIATVAAYNVHDGESVIAHVAKENGAWKIYGPVLNPRSYPTITAALRALEKAKRS